MQKRKKLVAIIGGSFFLLVSFFVSISLAQTSPSSWKLVFSDEFDRDGQPDGRKWVYDEGCTGWGNREVQCYTRSRPENARVEQGNLILEARRDGLGRHEYTSARIMTKGKAQWLYGRVEVRAKLPSGRGTWPGIWMLAKEWSYGDNFWPDNGEIDIMEHVGYAPGEVSAGVQTLKHNFRDRNAETKKLPVPDAETAFHVYAIEWSAKRIDFFVDDQKYFTVSKRRSNYRFWPFDKEFYLILNVAVGGEWGGRRGIDSSVFPQRMEIDYVRVYQ
jgi:beta-glucanase (GH16 family)